MDIQSKIILIFGPTASGKSKFAIQLAKRINGEIINADSMQVYKELKILTDRPKNKDLKIDVRPLNDDDIEKRKLPKDSTGVVITNIDPKSPVKNLQINNIIIEAQKKKIKTPGDLQNIVKSSLVANNKTILVVVYNNENQISYIGIKLK